MLRAIIVITLFCLATAMPKAASPDTTENGGTFSYSPGHFVPPSRITPYTLPESWPTQYDRKVVDMSPEGTKSRVVIIGSGNPIPNPYRNGPALAVIVNKQPYFVDAGEGIWRGISNAVFWQGETLQESFSLDSLKYLFVTHLHEDHTVGIPSFIFNPYKFHASSDKEIFGPPGTKSMVDHIVAAWTVDVSEMMTSHGWTAKGTRATTTDILNDGILFKDENITVEAFRTKHGSFEYSFAYRFTTPDRVLVFGGDGLYSAGMVKAAKDADVLFMEAVTEENIQYAPWGGNTLEQKKKTIFSYHIPPRDLVRLQEESGAKSVVLIHEQYYSKPEDYRREALMEEIKRAGMKAPIYSSIDGDIY